MTEATRAVASESRRIARNSVLLGAGDALALGLGFVTTILVTDRLGEDGYGLLIGAQRFVALFLVLAHFGLHPLLIRATASREDDPGTLLGTVLALRVGLGIAFLVGVAGGAMAVDYLPQYRWLLLAVAGMELIGSFAELFTGTCEGRERMGRSALVVVLRASVVFVGVVLVTLLQGDLPEIVAVYWLGRLLQLVAAVLLTPGAVPGLRLRIRWERLLSILREAVPYVTVGLAYMAMRTLDVMMLTRLSSIPEVSRYGAALNFFDALLVLPLLVQRALLPAFSRLHVSGSAGELARYTLIAFSLVLLPAAAGLGSLADAAMRLYPSGAFAEAAPVLRVLAGVLLFQAPIMVSATLLTGAGRLWLILACYAFALPAQALMNLLLIDAYGALGVAWGTMTAHGVLGTLLLGAARIGGLQPPVWAIARHALATAPMAALVHQIRDLPLVVPIAVGALVYAGLLWLLLPADAPERRLLLALRSRGSS